MPMEYLRKLQRDALPFLESDSHNIDKLRVLHAAGMVEVRLPPADRPQDRAMVLAVTGLGCATLRALEAGARVRLPPALTEDAESSLD